LKRMDQKNQCAKRSQIKRSVGRINSPHFRRHQQKRKEPVNPTRIKSMENRIKKVVAQNVCVAKRVIKRNGQKGKVSCFDVGGPKCRPILHIANMRIFQDIGNVIELERGMIGVGINQSSPSKKKTAQ